MPWRARADLPAELVEAIIVDAEVVADLVDHSPAYLVAHLILGVADGADGQAVDRDPVGQDPGVLGGAAGERHPLVEAEQPGRARAVLDRDGDVAHQLAEFLGQPVQRRGHHLFKPVRINVDHNSFSAGPVPAVIRRPAGRRSAPTAATTTVTALAPASRGRRGAAARLPGRELRWYHRYIRTHARHVAPEGRTP